MAKKPGDKRRRRAAATYREARLLWEQKLLGGAANRAYYALHQALVAACEDLNLTRNDFASNTSNDPNWGWPHQPFIEKLAKRKILDLDRADLELVGEALELRAKADYRVDPVEGYELEDTMNGLSGVLLSLKVTVDA